MKNLFLQLLITLPLFLAVGCTKDDTQSVPDSKLPTETTIGANTFGVTINGKVYIPRDSTGGGINPSSKGMSFIGSSAGLWNEIVVKDGASTLGFKMIIHFKKLEFNLNGSYQLGNSNFLDQADSELIDHIYFRIWDSNISNYAYYGSILNLCTIQITRFNGNATINWILSGKFSGKFVRYDNPNEFIQISDGRFDIGPGLYDKIFP